MQWFALVSTVVGAVLGVGATVTVDRLRWSRQMAHASLEDRSRLYSDYLADLATTRDALRAVARGFYADGETLHYASIEAFSGANLYSRRYQVSITAPEAVVRAVTDTFRTLRQLRDVVADGHDHTSEAYSGVRATYEKHLTELIALMQQDLSPLTKGPKAIR